MSAALVCVAVAVFCIVGYEAIAGWLTGLFGPPQVELQEAYSNDKAGPKVDHSTLDELLQTYVDEAGWVDYAGLRSREEQLDAYLQVVAKAPFADLARDDKLALLINAYNAFTLKLILENHPLESIQQIPEADRWDAVRWNVGGQVWSLNQIEHEQIRPRFVEPRIHFALVCAAVGCPPLRQEAFTPERLSQQLDSQAEYVHSHATWFAWKPEANTVELTKLYQWYSDDFDQAAGSVIRFASRYSPPLATALETDAPLRKKWLPYDWSLNSREHQRPR
ncbi:DUF547 domain-containing protein [Lignipirellula cremea]|uniref:DUF547 domain-containing protein n=1 Tax=Lignipirellula cremea TaxID=2528010 RepID=A0A518DXC6_9BACT|nr:DUF547 domain-containing protein [Lignipirellula cremea]QDU96496.1 hypothetical protein Pla8534_43170 [Lignipirellula cremea]